MEERAVAWVDRFGLYASSAERTALLGSASADFYCRFAPGAEIDGLLIATYWVYWGFAFDDAHCDAGPTSAAVDEFSGMADRLQRILESPSSQPPDDQFGAALHDIGRLMREHASPLKNERFRRAHRAWLSGVRQQVAHRSAGTLPDLDDYLAMRLRAAGGGPTFALLEVANGLPDISPEEMAAPAVRALTEMAGLIAALDNDRYSFAREADLGHTDLNIYRVLAASTGGSLADAGLCAANLRDQVLRRFLEVRDQVFGPASDALRRYVVDLGHGLRGNVEWGLRAARRAASPSAAGRTEPAPAVLTWRRPRAVEVSVDPRDVPCVAWWWDTPLSG